MKVPEHFILLLQCEEYENIDRKYVVNYGDIMPDLIKNITSEIYSQIVEENITIFNDMTNVINHLSILPSKSDGYICRGTCLTHPVLLSTFLKYYNLFDDNFVFEEYIIIGLDISKKFGFLKWSIFLKNIEYCMILINFIKKYSNIQIENISPMIQYEFYASAKFYSEMHVISRFYKNVLEIRCLI